MSSIRHDIKASMVHGLPYVTNKLWMRLPPESVKPWDTEINGDLEIHILTCQRDYRMCIWAALSYYRRAQRHDPLVIHDDGTLTEEALQQIRRYFPSSKLMTRTDADREVERVLSGHTRLRTLRREYSLLLKLIDTAVFCRAPRFIVIDSDVIFLENPVELISGCPSTGEGHTGSHYTSPHYISRDQESRYTVDSGIAAGCGWHLPSRINSGLINCSREHLDFGVMEDFLQSLDVGIHLPDCWYIEQTLWALECGRSGFTFLPDTYCLANGPGLEGVKAKHYVGANIDRLRNSRDYFYTEGIPAVREMLRSAGEPRSLYGLPA